jgi:tyrosine-specific transport protein
MRPVKRSLCSRFFWYTPLMNKTIGSIFVAAGTAIGGGMLALPLVSAGMGFGVTALLFLFVWAVMFQSALLTLEVNLAFQAPRNHYATMACATLGKPGKYITYLAYILLLYALTSAYVTGGASLLQAATKLLFDASLPAFANALIFTLVLGAIVAWSTRAVDLCNRGLFSFKIILLLAVFAMFLPQVDFVALFTRQQPTYMWVAAPVILTAFGFHIVIPSLAQYLGPDPRRLRTVLFWGSVLPLTLYLVWLASLLGTLPHEGEQGFAMLAKTGGSVGELMLAINYEMEKPWLTAVLNVFANVAVITSFLGVSLSLFDFLRDKEHEVVPHRARTAVFTFLPPVLIAIFYPNGFVQLLSYASIFVAVILIILPAVMAYRVRKIEHLVTPYHTWGGTPLLFFVGAIGVGFIVVEILRIMQKLPIWMG